MTTKNKLTGFQKPTIDEIQAYFNEIGVQPARAEAEAMYWHYESNGWMVGRTKMSSWKGACQTWKRSPYRQANNQSQPNGRPNGNYAPTGQAKAKISYITASNEQGSPMPDDMRGLFGSITGAVHNLVDKFTGKGNEQKSDRSEDNG